MSRKRWQNSKSEGSPFQVSPRFIAGIKWCHRPDLRDRHSFSPAGEKSCTLLSNPIIGTVPEPNHPVYTDTIIFNLFSRKIRNFYKFQQIWKSSSSHGESHEIKQFHHSYFSGADHLNIQDYNQSCTYSNLDSCRTVRRKLNFSPLLQESPRISLPSPYHVINFVPGRQSGPGQPVEKFYMTATL